MNIINKIKALAAKEVIGSTLKSGSVPTDKMMGWKAKAITALTFIAAVVGAALSYLQT